MKSSVSDVSHRLCSFWRVPDDEGGARHLSFEPGPAGPTSLTGVNLSAPEAQSFSWPSIWVPQGRSCNDSHPCARNSPLGHMPQVYVGRGSLAHASFGSMTSPRTLGRVSTIVHPSRGPRAAGINFWDAWDHISAAITARRIVLFP